MFEAIAAFAQSPMTACVTQSLKLVCINTHSSAGENGGKKRAFHVIVPSLPGKQFVSALRTAPTLTSLSQWRRFLCFSHVIDTCAPCPSLAVCLSNACKFVPQSPE